MVLGCTHINVINALEDVDFRHPRGLDKSLVLSVARCQWIREHHNVLISGPTGVGKCYLACALGHQVCRQGLRVRYYRAPRFFQELAVARGVGHYQQALRSLLRADLLILDDWGTALLSAEQRRDLLEVMEDRYDRRRPCRIGGPPSPEYAKELGRTADARCSPTYVVADL